MCKMTQQRLKELVSYNPENGVMSWRSPKGRVKAGTVISCKDSRGYIVVRLDGKLYRAHRLAWLYAYGYTPKTIDHVNRNTSDNRLCNLRACTTRQNLLNASVSSRNKTGYKGVSFDKRKQKYRACTSYNRKHVFLGYFNTAEDAYKKYLEHNADEITGEDLKKQLDLFDPMP